MTAIPTATEAIEYAEANNLSVEIPDGHYTGPGITINGPVSMILRQNAYLDFDFNIMGNDAMKSDSLTLSGDWDSYPINTTKFAGDFSRYAPGDVVMIELSNGGSPQFHEAGLDFSVVLSSSDVELVLEFGTRLDYRDPTISRLSNVARYNGGLSVESICIPGDYTGIFAVGDIIRIENIDGAGGVEGSQFYFEYAKIHEIDSLKITLESRTTHICINPWLIKVDVVKGVKMSGGGRIKRLNISNVDGLMLTSIIIDRAIYSKIHRYQVIGDIRRGLQEASTSNATWMFNGSMSDICCGGSCSSTDNAAFKVMSCPNMQISNISGGNTRATAQGNYGVFVDFFFTPYRIWNANLQAANIRADTPNGGSGRSIWIAGLKNGSIELTEGNIFLQSMVDSEAKVHCPASHLEVKDIVRSSVGGGCKYLGWQGCFDSIFNGSVRDTGGENSDRCVWVRSGERHPETGSTYTVGCNNEFNPINYSTNFLDVTIYIQSQDYPLLGHGCRDKLGLSASVLFGSAVTSPRMAPNFLQNSIPVSTSWQSARVKGYMSFDGGYADGGIILNGSYIFVDGSGNVRIHAAKPSADKNGVVVGGQV